MDIIGFIIIVLFFLLNMILIFLSTRVSAFKYQPEEASVPGKYPSVTFLIAARNEEHTIGSCIEAILAQDFPRENIQIIIGDDGSEDDTGKVAARYDRVEVYPVTEQVAGLVGKSNALAQIAEKARGEYLAFTDADIELNPEWLKYMLAQATEPGVGIVSGSTVVKDSMFQKTDWVYSLGMVKAVSDMNTPVTGVGNNMMIPRKVYEAVGGFKAVGPSIVEDYALFKRIVSHNYGFKNLFDKKTLAVSRPIRGFFNLLMQRKRWMTGALKLPFPILGILMLQSAFYPLLVLLMFVNARLACWLWAAKVFFQSMFIARLFIQLNQRTRFLSLIAYEFYSGLLSVCLLVFYILPVRVRWKGRKYK